MNIIEFLLEVKELHVFVTLVDGKLSVKGNRDSLTQELKEKLANNKAKILAVFNELGIESNNQIAPTTFSQQRLWFIDCLEGSSEHYNMPAALKLTGKVNVNAIQFALNKIIERHESLRTYFFSHGDEPYQIIRRYEYSEGQVIDLSDISDETMLQEEIFRLSKEESNKPFLLNKDLMLRWKIIKVNESEFVLLKTLHHIASDGWSLGILANEFVALYSAYLKDKKDPLPPLKIQYADYAHWQRHWLKGDVLESQLKYWTQKLSGIPLVHNLPLDRPRPAIQSYEGKTVGSLIDKDTADRFAAHCQTHGATLFMGLHALFSLLLSRYSGESDIVVGTPIANREQPDVAPLNGFFLNTLVFRSNLNKVKNFNELLEQSKATAWDAYGHQQVPFEQLVKELNFEPSLSYSPVFQIMLILQNNDSSELKLPDIKTEAINNSFSFAKFEITLNVAEVEEGLRMGWNFNTHLFDLEKIWLMAKNFEVLMKAVIEKPTFPLLSLPLLNDEEYEYCTERYNKEIVHYQKEQLLHRIFERQALESPEVIAVVSDECQLSYGELNKQSNKWAGLLLQQGVKPDSIIGICMPRSKEMIIAVLAILKAGAAYLPIDINYPKPRIDFMCKDTRLNMVLTHSELDFSAEPGINCINIDSLEFKRSVESFSDENKSLHGDDAVTDRLAYIIYTSGSTGNPKGVMVSHKNVHSYYVSANNNYQVDRLDRMLQFSTISFDMFVEEAFVTLFSGAALIFRNENILLASNYFWYFLNQQQITVASLPTAFWHVLCEQLSVESFLSNKLKLLIVGGESMSCFMLQKWRKHFKENIRLLNTYGPTETTVIATIYDTSEYRDDLSVLPIGKPISNTQCYILSEQGEVCPIGVHGELHIGGDSVSLGYLNNQTLTHEKFIPDRFTDSDTHKLYKTGDKVRMLIDGNIEFIGRVDEQVKIRGFRVELGEIENRVSRTDLVNSSLVMASENDLMSKSIVAYILPSKNKGLNNDEIISQLRKELLNALPEYMVPSSFIIVDEWPLTANGKIDRKALPKPENILHQREYIAAKTETETILVEIWAKLLNLEITSISINISFFELGGHSLLAVRMSSEISSQFGQVITIKAIFEHSDIESLASLLDNIKKQEAIAQELSSNESSEIEEIEW